MKRALAIALLLAAVIPPARAWAAGGKDDDEESSDDDEAKGSGKAADKKAKGSDDDSSDESSDDESSDDETSAPADKAKTATKPAEGEAVENDGLRPKQDLTGHDLGTNKKANEFERDRFFVDKVDSDKTADATLIQGSIASSSFFYTEAGGTYPNGTVTGKDNTNAGPSRLFTELRLQTDFRHIKASRWEGRIDARARFVGTPTNGEVGSDPNHIQSGLTGQNEYDVRELWLTRVGKRSDIFIGRQFIPDLGAVKIDGLRVDYAQSAKVTVLGFAGLFPLRGSRSVTTDYAVLKDPIAGNSAGRFVATAGGGIAYRTVSAYGSLGGVTQVPLQKEQPRIFVTSSGYLRSGSKLDIYHFVLVDLIGAAAQQSTGHIGLTNVSGGINFKPDARLRLTASVNRVDTETLNVQAGEYLKSPDASMMDPTYGGNKVVQNEAYLQRLATQQARGGASAGLGKQQRFEISTAVTYRERQAFTLQPAIPSMTSPLIDIPAAKSVEIWGSVVDRHSFKDTRIALDVARSFGIGKSSFQRSNTQTIRLFALREFHDGRGEWEGEISYGKVLNDAAGSTNVCVSGATPIEQQVSTCYGNANNTLISAGGQVVYRLRSDWLGIANLYVLRTSNVTSDGMGGVITDPATLGFTGFIRIAKRF